MHGAPRKRFGQHFLCDQNIIHRIVQAFAPTADQHLVEIGPGQGALTLPMLKRCRQLEVIELDRDLIPVLEDRCRDAGELSVYSADVLAFNFATIKIDDRLLRVFGNLPYNISTPLIFHLLSYTDLISDMLFMLQKEVAERMVALPNEKAYGRLSVMVQYHCEAMILFDVPPQSFYPPPKVQSSMIRLVPHQKLPVQANDFDLFTNIVRQAFSQRRKTLRNSLKGMVSDEHWSLCSIGSDARAENLSVKDFVMLSNIIKG